MIWHPIILFSVIASSVDGVMTSRLNVPCAELSSHIEPGLITKQPLSLDPFTSLAKHFALLLKMRMLGTIGKAANCWANPLSKLTLSDGGFRG